MKGKEKGFVGVWVWKWDELKAWSLILNLVIKLNLSYPTVDSSGHSKRNVDI